ncbi:PREDICTED: probable aminoacyl tRNA synthase complex-interacting multifunctional protein 2 isoform X2 [Dinoponera quadriceps]|uniref:Probable aminoacyl tRNA synthase complex-interacting multifunctional protein 2 isoform X2 n=1 Tax=Dinoponera quadriceps TaxID=609295 RepID=A0A6P3XYE7_DINQU|nr:PREDICTED: probable aminoacyl tRNA synthase complex-interacting multifunctional protein 2 isoform X2 [Dinoponera quadriceps]
MMYVLRPIVTSTEAHPRVKNMYEMRNIQGVERHRRDEKEETTESQTTMTPPPCDGTKMPDVTEQRTSPDYNTLATRQEEILRQLAELKAQISTLCKFLKRPGQEAMSSKILNAISGMRAARNCRSQVPVQVSLVLNVNPWKPPFSIYALQKLWKDTNITVKSYTHSTIIGRVPIDFPNSTHPDVNNVVNLTVIFKAVNDLEMVTSLLRYPVIGEVNFLRYLSRLLEAHNYERNDLAYVSATDNILDCCCRVRHQTSRDRIDEALLLLYQQLEQTRWRSGRNGEPDIADIAAWSTIKQFSSNRRLPRFIQEWYDICDETFMNNASAH